MQTFRIGWALAAVSLAVLMLVAPRAAAEGALAASLSENFSDQGWSIGYSADWANAAIAHREALRRCRENARQDIADRCRIVSDFHRECAAIAYVEEGQGRGFGWGIDRDLAVAQDQALSMCKLIAGPGNAARCKVKYESRAQACDLKDSGR